MRKRQPSESRVAHATAATYTDPNIQKYSRKSRARPRDFTGSVSARRSKGMESPPTPNPTMVRQAMSAAYDGATTDRNPKTAIVSVA
jgi:hypothetical protein